MSVSEGKKPLGFTSGACYRICIKGFLDGSWSDRFGGMHISNQADGAISPLSVLDGSLMDQTELIGVLNSLYEMRLPLVSVTLLDE